MASIAGLRGSSQAVLEGSLQLSGQTRLSIASNNRVTVARPGFTVRAQQAPTEPETGRRAVLGLVAAGLATGSFVQAVLADAKSIKVGPPPPPSGGLRKSSIIFNFYRHSNDFFSILAFSSVWNGCLFKFVNQHCTLLRDSKESK